LKQALDKVSDCEVPAFVLKLYQCQKVAKMPVNMSPCPPHLRGEDFSFSQHISKIKNVFAQQYTI
jgi:hypothetical protein